jgi:CDP-paratose 2-epimerase
MSPDDDHESAVARWRASVRRASPALRHEPHSERLGSRYALVTGGAGFIGTNLAHRLLSQGRRVVLFDDLSRAGVEENVRWLRDIHGHRVELVVGDVTDGESLERAVSQACEVYHFAAQVAVTSSLEAPLHDFSVNAHGTIRLLECLRALDRPVPLIFTSTNKVYGGCEDIALVATAGRYGPVDPEVLIHGIGEGRPLDFHSPYGCSKGSADQYVTDYARTFGIPTVVFRMSCIYGPHQCGNEDQGWVAHFARCVLEGRPITIYGDGRQVRDLLFVEDLVDAFCAVRERIDALAGHVFNVGGGPDNAASVLDVILLLSRLSGRTPNLLFGDWRPGDQRYYVSDIRRLNALAGWRPQVGVAIGIRELYRWLDSAMAASVASGRPPANAAARLQS